MSRYIDADALIKRIQDEHKFGSLMLSNMIAEMSTADVVEVVHGEWTDTTHGLICSACKTYQVYGSRFYNFCPICGADMRGGHNERE